MTSAYALDWFRQMLWAAVLTAGPVVLAVVCVGFVMAILQAATQVNDQAVAFGPKALAVVGALAAGGSWMLSQMVTFAHEAIVAMGHLHQ